MKDVLRRAIGKNIDSGIRSAKRRIKNLRNAEYALKHVNLDRAMYLVRVTFSPFCEMPPHSDPDQIIISLRGTLENILKKTKNELEESSYEPTEFHPEYSVSIKLKETYVPVPEKYWKKLCTE